jgi:arginase family enzyme
MPLRMLLDAGDVDPQDVILLGARNLDPPEVEFIAATAIRQELGPLPDRVYVALDLDVIRPGDLDVLMPEPGGPALDELERLLAGLPTPIGAGFTGGLRTDRNEALLPRLAAALGL